MNSTGFTFRWTHLVPPQTIFRHELVQHIRNMVRAVGPGAAMRWALRRSRNALARDGPKVSAATAGVKRPATWSLGARHASCFAGGAGGPPAGQQARRVQVGASGWNDPTFARRERGGLSPNHQWPALSCRRALFGVGVVTFLRAAPSAEPSPFDSPDPWQPP
jgi:hypothetical protein